MCFDSFNDRWMLFRPVVDGLVCFVLRTLKTLRITSSTSYFTDPKNEYYRSERMETLTQVQVV